MLRALKSILKLNVFCCKKLSLSVIVGPISSIVFYIIYFYQLKFIVYKLIDGLMLHLLSLSSLTYPLLNAVSPPVYSSSLAYTRDYLFNPIHSQPSY